MRNVSKSPISVPRSLRVKEEAKHANVVKWIESQELIECESLAIMSVIGKVTATGVVGRDEEFVTFDNNPTLVAKFKAREVIEI